MSDGIIAPGYTDEALAILKTKRKGGYNVVQIDPDYVPKPIEQRDIFGIRFEQGYNDYEINESLLNNIVTDNKDLPESAKHDMILSLITLKYTQSNSVCYAKDGMTIGVGAGQQSRIHCTRLAGSKADNWFLRQHPKVLGLQFVDGIRRPDRDNAIDVYISDEYEDVLADGVWQNTFKVRPEVLTAEEKKAWIAQEHRRDRGLGCVLPVRRQRRARAQVGRAVYRAAGRLDPRRQRHRDREQIRHRHGVHRHAPVPSLMLQPNPANAAGWTLAALAVQLTAGVAADAAGRLFGFALLLVCWLMNGYAALRLRCTAALAAAAAGAALSVLMMAGASGWAVSMASNLLFLLYYLPLQNAFDRHLAAADVSNGTRRLGRVWAVPRSRSAARPCWASCPVSTGRMCCRFSRAATRRCSRSSSRSR